MLLPSVEEHRSKLILFCQFMCSSEVCSSLEDWIGRSRVSSVPFCSLCVLSRSGLGEQRAGVGGVRGGLAPDLQRFPQLHLLLLDKPQLSQEVPPGASEAGAGPLPRPGPLNGRFQGALRVPVCGQQQPDPRALLQRVFHLHPGDADVAEDLHVGDVPLRPIWNIRHRLTATLCTVHTIEVVNSVYMFFSFSF